MPVGSNGITGHGTEVREPWRTMVRSLPSARTNVPRSLPVSPRRTCDAAAAAWPAPPCGPDGRIESQLEAVIADAAEAGEHRLAELAGDLLEDVVPHRVRDSNNKRRIPGEYVRRKRHDLMDRGLHAASPLTAACRL